MARAPKRFQPNYVQFKYEGAEYVVDTANREVLRNWVAIEHQAMLPILSACMKENDIEDVAVAS